MSQKHIDLFGTADAPHVAGDVLVLPEGLALPRRNKVDHGLGQIGHSRCRLDSTGSTGGSTTFPRGFMTFRRDLNSHSGSSGWLLGRFTGLNRLSWEKKYVNELMASSFEVLTCHFY